jgi:hypothetical protein
VLDADEESEASTQGFGGGAVFSTVNLSISDSSILDNVAVRGGGLAIIDCNMTMDRSSIVANGGEVSMTAIQ